MAWIYDNSSGNLYHNKILVYKNAYAGKGEGRNNPSKQCVKETGPIPSGKYVIGSPRTSGRTGKHIMDLRPMGHTACGRSAFQIHGNNSTNDASKGCIILPREIREKISNSGDLELIVRGPLWLDT